jgi:hypothetical protein
MQQGNPIYPFDGDNNYILSVGDEIWCRRNGVDRNKSVDKTRLSDTHCKIGVTFYDGDKSQYQLGDIYGVTILSPKIRCGDIIRTDIGDLYIMMDKKSNANVHSFIYDVNDGDEGKMPDSSASTSTTGNMDFSLIIAHARKQNQA